MNIARLLGVHTLPPPVMFWWKGNYCGTALASAEAPIQDIADIRGLNFITNDNLPLVVIGWGLFL